MGIISVRGSDKLRAAVLAMKEADRTLRSDINKATRQVMNPVWRELVAKHATSPLDRAVLVKGARIVSGNPPALVAATSKRALPGGLIPAQQFPAVEFGANTAKKVTYQRRSTRGTQHSVTRRTRRQLPARDRHGRVVYQAAAEIGPRLVALWVQLIIRKYSEAAEKAGN